MKGEKILPFLGEGGQQAVNAIDTLLDYTEDKGLDSRYADFLKGFREAIITSETDENIKRWLYMPDALKDPIVHIARLSQYEYRQMRFPEQYDENLDTYCCTDGESLKAMASDLCILAVYYLVHNSPEDQGLEYWKDRISFETEKRIQLDIVYRNLNGRSDEADKA